MMICAGDVLCITFCVHCSVVAFLKLPFLWKPDFEVQWQHLTRGARGTEIWRFSLTKQLQLPRGPLV